MRVIIWGINYAPEPTGISVYTTELAEYLQRAGNDVEVVTGFAYYPAWVKQPSDRWKLYRRELSKGIPVHRCWLYVPQRITALRRILHEASFVVSSTLRALFLRRSDVYVIVSPPLGLGVAAWLVSRLKRRPYLYHVQDLQPDSAAGMGMMQPGAVLRLLYACERFAYRHAAGVSGISSGMIRAFLSKGVPEEKIFLLPNWLRTPIGPLIREKRSGRFRQAHGIADSALLAVYSGNLGRKQGLDVLLEAAEKLATGPAGSRAIWIVIAGDGAGQKAIAEKLRRQPLPNVQLLPLLPAGKYQEMLRDADVALIPQLPGTGRVCFPSKLLSVLAAGLPVITAADEDSDLAEAVHEGEFGINVPAANAIALAEALRKAAIRPDLVTLWAERTRWVERYSPELMLAKFEHALRILGEKTDRNDRLLASLPHPHEQR